MAFPNDGYIKIFPAGVSIISGQYALNSDALPAPSRPVADLQSYFDARVVNMAVAPCIRRATEYPAASGVYVPAIGDYELQFSASFDGFEFYDGSYPGVPVHTTDLIKADFPMGMSITQLQLWINVQILFGPNRDRQIVSIPFKYFGSNFYTYTPGVAGLLSGTQASPATGSNSIQGLFQNGYSIVRAAKTFGITVPVATTVSALLGQPRAVIAEVFLLGVYNTQQFRLNPVGMADGESNILPGDISYLESGQQTLDTWDPDLFYIYYDDPTSTDPDFPGMTGVLLPRRNILVFNNSALTFIMPYGLPYGGRRLMLVGTPLGGTLFSGKFPLQNYNITLVNGSGLYRLVTDKRNDTYYDRSTTPVTTVDLAIPQPRAKTGYFNA